MINKSLYNLLSSDEFCCGLYIFHYFLDTDTEVLVYMNAISLELEAELHEHKLFYLQNEYSNLLCWPTFRALA